jgi:uncharacterized Zn-binding protein involved in type VI secretion
LTFSLFFKSKFIWNDIFVGLLGLIGILCIFQFDIQFRTGILVGLVGDTISPHSPWGIPHPPHEAATITDGSGTVFADGVLVAWVGSGNTCGHSIVVGSGDVEVGS